MKTPTPFAAKSRLSAIVWGCSLLMLTACSNQELYSDLTERQANEMVAVLRDAGIDASKQTKDGQFAILAPSADFSDAVRELSAQGYPRESFDSIGEVFKREGFVSSPLEERARLLHAMSQEMSNTLANIDGVVTARVHLVVPESNPLVDSQKPASASVFIKHRADRNLNGDIAQIKALVVNSIEGLAYENVTVALFAAEKHVRRKSRPRSIATEPAIASVNAPVMMVGGGLGLAASLGGLMFWRRGARPQDEANDTNGDTTARDAGKGADSAEQEPR